MDERLARGKFWVITIPQKLCSQDSFGNQKKFLPVRVKFDHMVSFMNG